MKSRALALLFALVLATGSGCKRNASKDDPASAQRAPAPVPAPEGLISEVVIPPPALTWGAVRTSLGDMPLVPNSPAVFLVDALGLPVSALDQLDLIVPAVGALIESHDDVVPIVGIHLKEGSRFIELVTPAGGRFTKGATEDGITPITPTNAKAGAWSYAISGNYLVIAQNADDVRRFAPFVTRTLPTRAPSVEDIVVTTSHDALAGPVSARLKKFWDSWKSDREAEDVAMRTKHGGSAPDFGDPAQALADIDAKAAKFFAILGDLSEARLGLTVESKTPTSSASYRVSASMKPLSGSGPASLEITSMPVAGAEPLLSLPSTIAVGLLTRDTAELRDQGSLAQADAISQVLVGQLEPDDKVKIEAALRSWSLGRGDWLTAGLLWAGPTRAAVLRGSVTDSAELGRGVAAMLRLLSIRAIADPLSSWVGDMKLTGLGPASAGDGVVQTVHVVRRPPKVQLRRERDKPAQNDTFDVVWMVGKEVFVS